jgi:hypothetical protein
MQKLYTKEETAELIGVSLGTLRRLVRNKEISYLPADRAQAVVLGRAHRGVPAAARGRVRLGAEGETTAQQGRNWLEPLAGRRLSGTLLTR